MTEVTGRRTGGGLTAIDDDESPVDLPFPSAPIEEMLRLMVKGVRAHQLYLHNNPTYLRALDALRASFPPIWEHADDFALQITEAQMTWNGVVVLDEGGKTSDTLPWTFYKDGVRELRFQKGFETTDLEPFLDVAQRARRNQPDEDDLLMMLWERELQYLRYRYVDVGTDVLPAGSASIESRFEAHVVDLPTADDPVMPEESLLQSRPGIVNLDDFDSTLYFLDEHEMEYLHGEVNKEYESDLRANVVGILLDIFETQRSTSVREEIIQILDNFMLHLLSAAQYHAVAYLLQEIQVAVGRATNATAEQKEKLARVAARLSETEALSQLLQSLDESRELPPPDSLALLFDQLHPASLEIVFSWLARMRDPQLKVRLEEAATRLVAANTAELVRLIGSSDAQVALEAARRAGALRSVGAVTPLIKRMTDGDVTMRLAVVQALTEIGSAGALQGLERALEDADRDVRVAAARTLATKVYRPALPRLEAIVKGKSIREADLTEKMAMFEAFGALCGTAGVPLLDTLLNGKRLLGGKREEPQDRACAAVALGRIGNDRAIESLQKASTDKEIVVRNAVNKALRGGGA